MEFKSISDLNPGKEIAIIINANTRLLTTLALMSALKYAGMQVLVIDCGSRDGSYEHFLKLMESHEFHIISAPLRKHGVTLDWVFLNIPFEKVLLIDSDIEILGDVPIKMMKKRLICENVFGSGFVHEGTWMHKQKMKYAYYEERAWIPLVFFKVKPVKEALKHSSSFSAKKIFNDFSQSILLSKLLAGRLYVPLFRNLKLPWLDAYRKEFHGLKPSLVYYDTGAIIYQNLKYSLTYEFAAIPWEINWKYILHFHGVTRLQLNLFGRNGTKLKNLNDYIIQRLKQKYGIATCL